MRAMILAAGRGERMGALTADLPKPLLKAGKNYLIEYSILSLVKIGILDIVINISYCAGQIKTALGDGSRYGVRFYYSEEPDVLETGGGILNALLAEVLDDPSKNNKAWLLERARALKDEDP